jgi:rhodanese-related sulfurtransferase
LVDVREQWEYDACRIEGALIPMCTIPANLQALTATKT